MTSRVLSFDIGIHNLAFCCLEKTGDKHAILAWDNVSLLTDESNVGVQVTESCTYCKAKPKYDAAGKRVCGKHTPPLLPPLKDASGNAYKALPKVAVLKETLTTKHSVRCGSKKDSVLTELAKFYSLPLPAVKKPKAKNTSMILLHDALRSLVQKHSSVFSTCTLICLENQPVFKNPQMKSVQMLLFATLRDLLQPNPPPVQLVHASIKVKGAAKGDEGYAERKKGSEDRAVEFLAKFGSARWTDFYAAAKKKNDLADALCMSLDHA